MTAVCVFAVFCQRTACMQNDPQVMRFINPQHVRTCKCGLRERKDQNRHRLWQ